jgi:hypothetical protein
VLKRNGTRRLRITQAENRQVLAQQWLVRAVKISVKRSLAMRTSLTRPAGEQWLLHAEEIDIED